MARAVGWCLCAPGAGLPSFGTICAAEPRPARGGCPSPGPTSPRPTSPRAWGEQTDAWLLRPPGRPSWAESRGILSGTKRVQSIWGIPFRSLPSWLVCRCQSTCGVWGRGHCRPGSGVGVPLAPGARTSSAQAPLAGFLVAPGACHTRREPASPGACVRGQARRRRPGRGLSRVRLDTTRSRSGLYNTVSWGDSRVFQVCVARKSLVFFISLIYPYFGY